MEMITSVVIQHILTFGFNNPLDFVEMFVLHNSETILRTTTGN